jgi:acylphosphatase
MATFKVPGKVTRVYDTEVTITADSPDDAIAKAKDSVSGEFVVDETRVREIEVVYRNTPFALSSWDLFGSRWPRLLG